MTVTVTTERNSFGEPASFVIHGPRFTARVPACAPDCRRTPCLRTGKHGLPDCKEQRRKGWNPHSREFCHSGGHLPQVEAVAELVRRTYRRPPARRQRAAGTAATFGPMAYRGYRDGFLPLDGEETVRAVPAWREDTPKFRPADVWRVVCNSPRCRTAPVAEVPIIDMGVSPELARREAEKLAEEARDEHAEWHRRTFGTSDRVLLDRWIRDHARQVWPEVDRDELDRQLAVARREAAQPTTPRRDR